MSKSRSEKVLKLQRAVGEWRGKTSVQTGGFVVAPKPSAAKRVARWVHELGLPVDATMKHLAQIKTYDAFHAWLRETFK